MYPDINHNLRFLLDHHPKAYAVDRTTGANPIQQYLDNLANAGSLYGNIIYHKSPVVMNQLELILGKDNLQKGLRNYLLKYSYSNARWDDLIPILDAYTPVDLNAWSSVWVKDAGMPDVKAYVENDKLTIEQHDASGSNKSWPQKLTVLTGSAQGYKADTIFMDKNKVSLPLPYSDWQFVLPSADHNGYGNFSTDKISAEWLLENINSLGVPLYRGTAWLTLNEMMINQAIVPSRLMNSVCKSIGEEKDELILNYVLGVTQGIYWKWLDEKNRAVFSDRLEKLLWLKMEESTTKSVKSTCFKTFLSIASTLDAQNKLYAIWNNKTAIQGLKLSENDKTRLVCELALRGYANAGNLLNMQLDSIKNIDNRARLKFIIPSLSQNISVRNSFFETLKNRVNRNNESWTTEALGYLNHPLRETEAIQFIKPGLQLLEEIKTTGDIFFPASWLGSLLSGHRGKEAAEIVRQFLSENKQYPLDLQLKIRQSADLLFRLNPTP